MNNISSIYKIQNKINGKCYIGFHEGEDCSERWKSHIKGYSGCKAINSAIKKYGEYNFTFEIICRSKDKDFLLKEMEQYFIEKYDSFGKNGYNLSRGGKGPTGHTHTEETRKLISKNRGPATLTDEGRKSLSENGKKGSDGYNKRFTEKTREKQSDNMKSRIYKEGFNAKASKWIIKTPENQIIQTELPTIFCKTNNISFKELWYSYKKGRPVTKGKFKGWQLLEIIKLENKHNL